MHTVLELCVGPSLRDLERAYACHDIRVVGNDLDPRWVRYYPQGQWLVGDALAIEWAGFDAVVFAPPLSRGCTGRREDALRVDEVFPRYSDFLARLGAECSPVAVMVLPGRALATPRDRAATHHLLARCCRRSELVPLLDERGRVCKYHDLYLYGEPCTKSM